MKIECLFIRRSGLKIPELIAAWDEYTISENPEGWETECDDALISLKGDYQVSRFITVEVPESALEEAIKYPWDKPRGLLNPMKESMRLLEEPYLDDL